MGIKKRTIFTKPPEELNDIQKEELAKKFISSANKKGKKEPEEGHNFLYLRVPKSIHQQLQRLRKYSGLSVTALCIEILRKGIKEKLKEFEDDEY